MLSVFATELTTTQSELETLLAKVDALRGQMKSLKANQAKVSKFIDNCKNLLTELPELAIAELKKEILSLFPSYQAETKESAPVNEVFPNFVTEVPKTEFTTPEIAKTEEVKDRWNPAHFEPMEYQAENNGQFNLLQPTTTEPPEPDDYSNLQDFEAAWEAWEKKEVAVCSAPLPQDNLIDLSGESWEQLKVSLKPIHVSKPQTASFLIVKGEPTPVTEEAATDDDDQWPEVEPVTPEVEPPKENDFATTEYLNDTVMFIKKHSGEILAGYIACMNRGLASDWAECLNLWGCNAEFRKAKRFGKGIQWEVKITKISIEQLITVANNHSSLYSSVPAGNQENAKKFLSGKAETNENLSDSKTLQPQSNLPKENSEITTEQKASVDAEIILKSEQAKADIIPNYSQPNQQKVFAGDLIRVKSNCHHKSAIGLTGVVTIASQTGCIAQFETIGNRWLTNDQIEIVKESKLVG
ncbi:hypothetical protein [Floridanema aerugineum]|uniref:Uncharacterized protein n=1 Tax=Floridaenema aerugineum BLCC-F46 TaxID=3153654 RepID=A0ABV4X324_9CYAN